VRRQRGGHVVGSVLISMHASTVHRCTPDKRLSSPTVDDRQSLYNSTIRFGFHCRIDVRDLSSIPASSQTIYVRNFQPIIRHPREEFQGFTGRWEPLFNPDVCTCMFACFLISKLMTQSNSLLQVR